MTMTPESMPSVPHAIVVGRVPTFASTAPEIGNVGGQAMGFPFVHPQPRVVLVVV